MRTSPTGTHARLKTKACRQNSFTIIELVAIVGVIGLMMMMVMPALDSFGKNTEILAAARDLSSTISQMRQDSITNRRKSWMIYDLSENTIHPAYDDGEGGIAWLALQYLPEGVSISRVTSSETDGDNEISFYPTGLVESHSIELEGEYQYIILEVNALTGAVTFTKTSKDGL